MEYRPLKRFLGVELDKCLNEVIDVVNVMDLIQKEMIIELKEINEKLDNISQMIEESRR